MRCSCVSVMTVTFMLNLIFLYVQLQMVIDAMLLCFCHDCDINDGSVLLNHIILYVQLQMVIDAMLLCFCHDCDINDGSVDRPFFASESLQVGASINPYTPVGKGYTRGDQKVRGKVL